MVSSATLQYDGEAACTRTGNESKKSLFDALVNLDANWTIDRTSDLRYVAGFARAIERSRHVRTINIHVTRPLIDNRFWTFAETFVTINAYRSIGWCAGAVGFVAGHALAIEAIVRYSA